MNFLEIADRQGWSDATKIGMLLEYIENQNSPGAFDDFIQQAINNDSELSEERTLEFLEFVDMWVAQECNMDNKKDERKLKSAIESATDDGYKEVFEVIQLWSQKPLKERINTFLVRNNAVLTEEMTVVLNTFV